MSRPEELPLRDILGAIETIRAHLAEGEFDRKTSDAVLYGVGWSGFDEPTRVQERRRGETDERTTTFAFDPKRKP